MLKLSKTRKSAIIAEDQAARIAESTRKFREHQDAHQHTPTPWQIGEYTPYTVEHGRRSICSTGGYSSNVNPERVSAENIANAEFIVRACNSHERVVAALKAIIACEAYPGHIAREPYPATCMSIRCDALKLGIAALEAAEGDHHEG
jgi:hypothetical protein